MIPLRVGLTGGIGCGKTTVARLFAELGVPILDADCIARELVEPGRPALAALVGRFGPEILEDGQLNRARLRGVVFSDPQQRAWLEHLLHPLVYAELAARAAAADTPYALLVIPLLLETGRRDQVDRLLVVDCPVAVQRLRVRARDGLPDTEIDRILAAQVSRERRLTAADDIVDNTAAPAEDLRQQVERLHRVYLDLAARRPVSRPGS